MVTGVIDRFRRWLGGSSLKRKGPPVAAVTLPSGDLLVFDLAGRVREPAGGLTESDKGAVAQELGTAGRFFRLIGERKASGWVGWVPTSDGSGGSGGRLQWEDQIELEFTAIECTVDAWLTGGLEGQPAGRASYVVDRRHPLVVSPDNVWALIRESVLRSPS